MRTLLAVALLASAVLAGCAKDADPAANIVVTVGPATSAGEAILWTGAKLVGPPPDDVTMFRSFFEGPPEGECRPGQCETVPFQVGPTPPGAVVVVAIEWEGQDEDYEGTVNYVGGPRLYMDMQVLQDGRVVADGAESGHYASVARLLEPKPGDYELHVRAVWGTGSYQASVLVVEPTAAAAGDLLPDLVMLPPDHVRIEHPMVREASPLMAPVQRGCGPDETVEDQDTRCLRFAGIIGNQGPGALELILEYDQATGAAVGSGSWDQRIFDAAGGSRTERVAPASYHAVHGHYHILEFVATQLYAVDEAGQRGEPVGDGRKMGFCLIDGGLIDQRQPAVEPAYFGFGCCYFFLFCQLDMATHERFFMGIGPGWYDIYPWYRSDQYVEVTGLPDGVYDLVTVVNPGGNLFESDMANNEAATRFRLTGDDVEILDMGTQAVVGPHPDADWQ